MLSVAVLVLGLTSLATPAPPATAAAADPFASPENYLLHVDDDADKLFPPSVPSHPTTADPLATQIQDEPIYKELEEFLRSGVEEYLDRALEMERERKLRRPMDSPSVVSTGPPRHAGTRPTMSLPVFSVDETAALTAAQLTPRKHFHPPVQNGRHVWSSRPETQLRPMTRVDAMIPYPGLRPPSKIRPPPRIHPPPTIYPPPAIHPPPIIHPPSTIHPLPIIRPLPTIQLPPTVLPPPVSRPAPATSHPQLVEVNKQKKLQRFMEFIKKNRDLLIQFIANKHLQRQQERRQRLASTSRNYLGTKEGPALRLDPPLVGQGSHARPEQIPVNDINVDENAQELHFANAGIFGDTSLAGPESFVKDTAGLVATDRGVMAARVTHGVTEVAPASATAIDRGPKPGETVAAYGRQVEADWREQATALAALATRSQKRAMIADNNPHHQHLPDGVTRFLHPGERPMTPRPGASATPVMRARAERRLDENWLVLADGTTRLWPLRSQTWGRLQETTLLDGLSGKDLDLLPARGADIYRLRNKERLCQRHQLRAEGPKYHRDGREYRPRRARARPFPATAPPRFLIPICCNCCRKSVLSCE